MRDYLAAAAFDVGRNRETMSLNYRSHSPWSRTDVAFWPLQRAASRRWVGESGWDTEERSTQRIIRRETKTYLQIKTNVRYFGCVVCVCVSVVVVGCVCVREWIGMY